MTPAHLSELLEEAAERGASKALASVGLHDENAANDIREIRGLLDSWRLARQTVIRTAVKYVTVAILGAISFAVLNKYLGNKLPPIQ